MSARVRLPDTKIDLEISTGDARNSTKAPQSTEMSILGLSEGSFLVFVGYLVVLCTAVAIYLPWEDEGRAWVIARDYSLTSMLFQMLRFEGHPALWYLILWVPSHLHMAYVHINWISATIAVAGTYVLLRYSPFPFYLRMLLPFGFALQFQYAVVARSYALFPLLGFLVAHLYRNKEKHPIAFAMVLALFANVSVHATLIAVGLAFAIWLESRQGKGWECPRRKKSHLPIAIFIFTGGLCFVAVCLWPPVNIQTKIMERLRVTFSAQRSAVSEGSVPSQNQNLQSRTINAHQEKISFLHRTADTTVRVLTFAVSSYRPLAFLYEALIVLYLYQLRKLSLLLPFLLLVGFLVFGYERPWHLQMIWVLLLLLLWMVRNDPLTEEIRRLQRGIEYTLLLLCVLQIWWTVGALHYERSNAMFPSQTAAEYLKTLPSGKRIAGRGRAVTLLPYFSQGFFVDFSPNRAMDLLPSHPDLIIGDDTMSPAEATALSAAHYRETHRFCGSIYFPGETSTQHLCLLVFETFLLQTSGIDGGSRSLPYLTPTSGRLEEGPFPDESLILRKHTGTDAEGARLTLHRTRLAMGGRLLRIVQVEALYKFLNGDLLL